MKIAYFISPHGYGHATRSIAIMQALAGQYHEIEFLIFSSLSEQIFHDELSRQGVKFRFFNQVTDVGLYQYNAFEEDIDKTVQALEQLIPFADNRLLELAQMCRDCCLVLCDIAALGIAVAKQAGIPSVLIENFTWDWIYQPYMTSDHRLQSFAQQLQQIFSQADFHIQLQPVCEPKVKADLLATPVFRPHRQEKAQVFADLPNINGRKIVLITMGGIKTDYGFIQRLTEYPDYFFVIPSAGRYELTENALLLPVATPYYHPDLIHASDLVICKTGYSTMAELYHSGVPCAFLGREKFPESEVIERFVEQYLSGIKLAQTDFDRGDWMERLPELMQLQRKPVIDTNGADQIRDFLGSIASL